MLRKISTLALVTLALLSVDAQKNKNTQYNDGVERPKLVVGIVVDQMRWDFLYKYQAKYGNGGFKRLLNEGYSFNNVMIDYIPTVTALGHTSIYTGSVPSIHGIAGNDWTDKETGKNVYCTTDETVNAVGTEAKKIGQHSPRNLWSTTITDQLGIATNFRSKVVGVSLKDRASILPAGHNPTAAFWFDETTGNFITSDYYLKELPQWLNEFNKEENGKKLVSKGWKTLLPISEYFESTEDNVAWESLLGSAKTPTFPYENLAKDYEAKKGVIRTTPFGNSLTLKMAEATIKGYKMGEDNITDFLAINIASTDYVGHAFGPNSIEIEDTYLRLDRDLEAFFQQLDKKVGKGNYLVFLSADHGGAHAEGYMQANKMMTGFFDDGLEKNLGEELEKKYAGSKLILGIDNYQIYLNHNTIKEKGLDADEVKKNILSQLNKDKRVLYAVDLEEVAEAAIPNLLKPELSMVTIGKEVEIFKLFRMMVCCRITLKKELPTAFGIHTTPIFH